MGNHYDRLFTRKISFFPMLCSRPSLKDVNLPQPELRSKCFTGDPLSPRITCIGQVKKRNKTNTPFNQTATNNVRYHKLKKLFSAKDLTPSAASFSAAAKLRRQRVRTGGVLPEKGVRNDKFFCPDTVDLAMDPPLPVVKKVKNGEGIESLWRRRRSEGAALRSLELQQIHHFRPHFHLQTTSNLITTDVYIKG